MKNISIQKLEIRDFKGISSRVLELDGKGCDLRGMNGTGKTTTYDAVCWVLFGKDSRGNAANDRSDFQIKPIGGAGMPEVTLLLDVNGEAVELRKVYKEVWTKKRGAAESSYSGNTTECYFDGVPLKEGDFKARVNMLVTEDEWRLLTNVYWFPRDMAWRERRGMLYQLCGVPGDERLMRDFGMDELAEDMGKLTMDDYKAKLRAERQKLNKALEALPIRMDEAEKIAGELRGMEFERRREWLGERNAEAAELREKLAALRHGEAEGAAKNALEAARLRLEAIERENALHRAAQEAVPDDREALKREIMQREKERHTVTVRMEADEQRRAQIESETATVQARIEMTELRIDEYRKEWDAENRRKMSEKDGKCPNCGRVLPPEMFAKAKDEFEAEKDKRKTRIVRDSELLKAAVQDDKNKTATLRQEDEWLEKTLNLHRETIQRYDAELAALWKRYDEAAPLSPAVRDMEGYQEQHAALCEDVRTKEAALRELMEGTASVRDELSGKLAAVECEIERLHQVLAKEAVLQEAEKRLEAYQAERGALGVELNRVDGLLYQCEDFLRRKSERITESVNGLFRRARFRLFREQVNGGLEEVCDVMLDGKPYGTLSDGEKIKLGLDVIEGLSARMAARLPLFVDGAESVTEMPRVATQTITLTVDESCKEVSVR